MDAGSRGQTPQSSSRIRRVLSALRTYLDSWAGIGRVAVGITAKATISSSPGSTTAAEDLRIDRVPVRQDDRGRWWYRLEGSLEQILGIIGRFPGRHFRLDPFPCSSRPSLPGVGLVNLAARKRGPHDFRPTARA